MLILPKLGSQISSSIARIIDNAPIAVESVFSTIAYPGFTNSPILENASLNLVTRQAMSLINFSTNVVFQSLAVDSNDNVYLVGSQNSHSYMTMTNPYGVLQWSQTFSDYGSFYGIKIDSSNNIYIVGDDGNNLILLKCNVSGTIEWQTTLSLGSSAVVGNDIAIDTSGNIYVTGVAVTSPFEGIVAAYNNAGTLLWQDSFSLSGSNVSGSAIALDTSGNLYIAFTAQSTTVVASGVNNTPNTAVGGVVKYTIGGTYESAIQFYSDTTGYCTGQDISVDSLGNVYLAGTFDNGGFGGIPVIIKLNSALSEIWQYSPLSGHFTATNLIRIAVDALGDIYFDLQGSALSKINSSGSWQWTLNFNGFNSPSDLVFDTNNNIYICGESNTSFPALNLSDSGTGTNYTTGAYLTFHPGSTAVAGSAGDVSMASFTSGTGTTMVTIASITLTSVTGTLTSAASVYTANPEPLTTALFKTNNTNSNGGLVWIKATNNTYDHCLFDTVNGNGNSLLVSNSTAPLTVSYDHNDDFIAFIPGGFFADANLSDLGSNSDYDYVTWMFARHSKFFDIVSYIGNGTTQTISHSLGIVPGFILLKSTSETDDWVMYHISEPGCYAELTAKSGFISSVNKFGNNTASVNPTIESITIGDDPLVNNSGSTYTMYIFAHDPTSTGLIQCGSYTGNNSASGPVIDLGWEPSYILILPSVANRNAVIFDEKRGITADGYGRALIANVNTIDTSYSLYNEPKIAVNANGFQVVANSGYANDAVLNDLNVSGISYNYVAIRKGPMTYPVSGTQVFGAISYLSTGSIGSIIGFSFSPDLLFSFGGGHGPVLFDKLRGIDPELSPPLFLGGGSYADTTCAGLLSIIQNGFEVGVDDSYGLVNGSGNNYIYWGFKRAPGFFDIVCYTGNGSSQTLNHNLGAIPNLMIVANRNTFPDQVICWTTQFPNDYFSLNGSSVPTIDTAHTFFGNGSGSVLPTTTEFTIGTSLSISSMEHVVYLFASLPGVSLIGTYIGNGGTQEINCNFPNFARFIMIKNVTASGNWFCWDVARGITSASAPHTSLNSVAADVSSDISISFCNTGFNVIQNTGTNINVTSNEYLFFAIS